MKIVKVYVSRVAQNEFFFGKVNLPRWIRFHKAPHSCDFFCENLSKNENGST